MRRLVLLLVVVAATAAGGGYALASEDAQQAHGSLRSQPLVEGCTSPRLVRKTISPVYRMTSGVSLGTNRVAVNTKSPLIVPLACPVVQNPTGEEQPSTSGCERSEPCACFE